MSVDLEDIRAGHYDAVDFGCSNGQSIEFAIKRLGAKSGIGIDNDPEKVAQARSSGYNAVQCDIHDIGQLQQCCSFVTAFHFLEHLPGYKRSRTAIHSAMNAASDYVVIKVPWFESDGWLFDNGLKFFWSDWHNHDYSVSQLDLFRAVRDSGKPAQLRMYGRRSVRSSEDLALHQIDAKPDQRSHRADIHGEKPIVEIPDSVPTFYELQAIIMLSDRVPFERIEAELDGGQDNRLAEFSFG